MSDRSLLCRCATEDRSRGSAWAPRRCGVAALTGAVEPPAALLAFATVCIAAALLPFGLAFAAGARLYVVVDELVPESHACGNERAESGALLVGFDLMLAVDNAFG